MAKARDAKQINRIFERMGYPAPVPEQAAKKEKSRVPFENSSKERGTGARASTVPTMTESEKRPSVKAKLAALQAAAKAGAEAPAKEISKTIADRTR